jgi:hypothetical protein
LAAPRKTPRRRVGYFPTDEQHSDFHLRREALMASLKYRVREDSTGWRWEVFTDDGQTVARGTEPNQSTAMAAAFREGIPARRARYERMAHEIAEWKAGRGPKPRALYLGPE